MSLDPGSPEHLAFLKEFYTGRENSTEDVDGRPRDLLNSSVMRAKLKLIKNEALANYSFYGEAAHPCRDTVIVPLR